MASVAGTAEDFRALLLNDYRLACISREASLLGRKEVLGGKAKFGIFGDGKELAQIALSKVVRNGCLLYTSPSPRDQRGSRMPSSA